MRCRFETWAAAVLLAVMAWITSGLISDRPPCEVSPVTGHCGCEAKSCDMSCMGCCPGGCKLPKDPTSDHVH